MLRLGRSWPSKRRVFGTPREEVLSHRRGIREEYHEWALFARALWKQKSKEIWPNKGDRNVEFFNKMANSHRSNFMTRIKINENWLFEEDEIKEGVARLSLRRGVVFCMWPLFGCAFSLLLNTFLSTLMCCFLCLLIKFHYLPIKKGGGLV